MKKVLNSYIPVVQDYFYAKDEFFTKLSMKNHKKIWDNYHKFTNQRGELVAAILSQFSEIKKKNILDIGCGDGGTSLKLSQLGANVTAVDIRPDINKIFKNTNIKFHQSTFDDIFFGTKKFDIVILQDVLEHVQNPETAIKKIRSLLLETSIIYISTPNRFSLLNVFSDPHWSLPFVSLFSRKWVKLAVKNIFLKDRRQREDWAALLSLFKLKKILNRNQFEINFVNSFVGKHLFEKPESIVCKPSHLKLIKRLKQGGFNKWVEKIVNDKFGFFNYYVNPTWYVVALNNRKKIHDFVNN